MHAGRVHVLYVRICFCETCVPFIADVSLSHPESLAAHFMRCRNSRSNAFKIALRNRHDGPYIVRIRRIQMGTDHRRMHRIRMRLKSLCRQSSLARFTPSRRLDRLHVVLEQCCLISSTCVHHMHSSKVPRTKS